MLTLTMMNQFSFPYVNFYSVPNLLLTDQNKNIRRAKILYLFWNQ